MKAVAVSLQIQIQIRCEKKMLRSYTMNKNYQRYSGAYFDISALFFDFKKCLKRSPLILFTFCFILIGSNACENEICKSFLPE